MYRGMVCAPRTRSTWLMRSLQSVRPRNQSFAEEGMVLAKLGDLENGEYVLRKVTVLVSEERVGVSSVPVAPSFRMRSYT